MNADFRIATDFFSKKKTVLLRRQEGDIALICLIRLWAWAAMYRPDGDLAALSEGDIDRAAGWAPNEWATNEPDPGPFVRILHRHGFVDGEPDGWRLHDWAEHQPWVCGSERRVRAAKIAAKARWDKRLMRDASFRHNAPSLSPPEEPPLAPPKRGGSGGEPKKTTGNGKTARSGHRRKCKRCNGTGKLVDPHVPGARYACPCATGGG